MKRPILLMIVATLLLGACDKLPGPMGQSGKSSAQRGAAVAVLDLGAVAKALGRDEVFKEQMESARQQLRQQLTDFSTGLEGKLREEQAKLGESPTPEQQQALREKLVQAQRQVQQSQVLARQKALEFQTSLAAQFRQEVEPAAAAVAKSKGATAVLLSNTLMWFEPTVDITGAVIDEMRARGATSGAPAVTGSETEQKTSQ